MNDTTAPTTFELDINPFGAIVDPHVADYYLAAKIAGDVIGEYQRQLAAAGFVVRREDSALRKRAERLRRSFILSHEEFQRGEVASSVLQPGDLADDLVPPEP